jgi:DNA replication regulator DPB11
LSIGVQSGHPLAGVFICCTALDPDSRDQVHRIAQDLGAEWSLDLTVRATLLVIGTTNSPKYNWVAKERPDMKVVFPEFMLAVRDIWIKGEEANVAELEEMYRVPALYGQKICITGFRDRK